MDVLDHLNDRPTCRACSRLIPFSDDFCSECRRLAAGVPLSRPLDSRLDDELATILAAAS
jgi:predicted amidophosphoribosyltransferase